MPEQWRPVVGYEGLYEVSDEGRVKTTRRKGSAGGLMKPQTAKCGGYWVVALYRDGQEDKRYVHALVVETFTGPRPSGLEIRHLDGDPQNARLSNLCYGTSAENKIDQVRHGTHYTASRTHCPSGHPYDAENTYVPPSRPNARYCRACARRRSRDRATGQRARPRR